MPCVRTLQMTSYIVTCLLSHKLHSGGWSGVLVQRSVYDCRHMHQLLSLSRDDVGTEWQQAIGKVKSCYSFNAYCVLYFYY